MKKKYTRTIAGFIIMAAMTLPACDYFENCGTCEKVVDDGTNITYPEKKPVCGDAYLDLLYSTPVTENGVTTYWNCY